jgi:signal transduction histidine kinase
MLDVRRENRMVASMRLVLASAGLGIVLLDPAQPDRLVTASYITLFAYTTYSLALYVLARRAPAAVEPLWDRNYWIDVAWYTVLVALSSGTNSVFFFGYLFASLVASLRRGRTGGILVAVVSATLFALVGVFAPQQPGQPFDLNRFLLRPTFLVALGYMMASFGGFEIMLRRRMALLREVSTISNPRFGVDRTVGRLMERLRAFYGAECCLVLMPRAGGGETGLRRCDRQSPDAGLHAVPIPAPFAERMLALPPGLSAVYARQDSTRLGARFGGNRCFGREADTGHEREIDERVCEAIASTLGVPGFATVPVRRRGEPAGRLYIGSRRPFRESDLEFLEHLIDQVTPVIDNVRLVDRLASDAGETERQRIARDIHDSIVQSFVGIDLGLSGLRERASGDARLADEVGRLQAVVRHEMEEARRYVSGLRASRGRGHALAAALERFISKFSYATGIGVRLDIGPDVMVTDRLAAQVLHIVEEGLSNVRRHTASSEAIVGLFEHEGHLVIRLENQSAPAGGRAAAFMPRSISERAAALGGRTIVETREDGTTSVETRIPL